MKDASLRDIGLRLGLTIALVIIANLIMFTILYADTFTPLSLPYAENFDTLQRLVYRQFGGKWQTQDGALLQTDQNDTDLFAVIPLRLSAEESYRFSSAMRFVGGAKGGGLMFNLQHADSRKQSQIVRFGVDPQGVPYLACGYFDENLNFVSQGGISPFEAISNTDTAALAVVIHQQQYDVLVNGTVVQKDLPLQYFGGYPALTTWFSQIAFDDVQIETLTPQAPAPTAQAAENAAPAPAPTQRTASGVLFTDAFDDVAAQSNWQRFSGEWTFEPGALVQTNVEGFDFGASAPEKFDQYTLRVQFRHRQGEGGGVLFNMPYRDSARGGQMVRYFPDNMLIWGYFNERGEFQGQGSQAVAPAGDAVHTLEIQSGESTYAITLDGSPLIAGIPLVSKSGYIGLTASQSSVSFEQVDVLNAGVAATAAPKAQGDWVRDGETLTQQNREASDYFTSTGVNAEAFRVSVQITAPEGTGGGLAFGSASDDSIAGATLVRLMDGGRRIEWGTVDLQGNFQPQGSSALNSEAGLAHSLEVSAASGQYSIAVDGSVVASAVSVQTHEGWIDFASVGGPVMFANFRLSLTEITDKS